MLLIVGLGNPGPNYRDNRHNMGYQVVELLSSRWNIPLKEEKKFHGMVGKGAVEGKKAMLAQPTTYMNNSGTCVSALMRYLSLPTAELLVIYDDVDLPIGRLRMRINGSAGSHNGMKSVIEHLKVSDFLRLRVGIGQQPEGWDLADYVLGNPTAEEKKLLLPALAKAADVVDILIKVNLDRAIETANRSDL
ncbi:MAG: aminoacyl-tRNA hydrolase [Christensenellales bacterium]|jgi:PTH1 family peptidyl-tRNA hydrolase